MFISAYKVFCLRIISANDYGIELDFFQILESQANRDQEIIDLAETMCDMYTFIAEAQGVGRHDTQAKLLGDMIKETKKCACFIRDYAKQKTFGPLSSIYLYPRPLMSWH